MQLAIFEINVPNPKGLDMVYSSCIYLTTKKPESGHWRKTVFLANFAVLKL
jgi:hypothetical protein